MSKNNYINLNRNFYSISKNDSFSDDFHERTLHKDISKPLHWDDIENEHRVVILAEAGAGKTVEIQQSVKRIRQSKRQAFFLRLEYLKDNIENSFDSDETGTFEEFEAWLETEQEAWFFLDSVDEARLSNPRNFESALRQLARSLKNSMHRSHIFITSRISEWRPVSDLNLFVKLLPFKGSKTNNETTDTLLESSISDTTLPDTFDTSEIYENSSADEIVKFYSLGDLDSEQVKIFTKQRNVCDPERFFEEIERLQVGDYLSRPQDLTELINFWKKSKRIGSRLELIQNDIELKLRERDPNRDTVKPLDVTKTRLGIQKLAAAITFQKLSRIKVPDSENSIECIDAGLILDDWKPTEISALLMRPIFDQVLYGTVRFHHRSVREYLTAE